LPRGHRSPAGRRLLPGRDLRRLVRRDPRTGGPAMAIDNEITTRRRSLNVSLLYGAGMLLIYFGERVIAAGSTRAPATGLGVLWLVAACAWRGIRMARAQADTRSVERTLFYLYLLGVAAIALYFAQSDVLALMPKSSPGKESKLPLILAALWPAVW